MAPPVIVLGVGRSGTTLLRVMLDRSSQVAIPYESFFVTPLAHRHGRRPCRWASCGTKNVSYGIASSLLRSSITRRSVVPERPTPRMITGGAIAAGA